MNFNIQYHAGKQVMFSAKKEAVVCAHGQLQVEVA